MFRLTVAAALAAASLPQPALHGDPSSRVVAVHRQRTEQAGIVGSSLMFLKAGAVTLKSFTGYQDLATKRPVDEETIYHWASVTKTLTGVAIMTALVSGSKDVTGSALEYRRTV